MRKLALTGTLAVAAATLGWLYYAPRLAAVKLRVVATVGDTARLGGLVDFTAMRRDLREAVDSSIQRQLRLERRPVPAEQLAAFRAQVMARADRATSPMGLIFAFRHGATHEPPSGHVAAHNGGDVVMHYGKWDYDQLHVSLSSPSARAGDSVVVVMGRQGLKWRAVGFYAPDLFRP